MSIIITSALGVTLADREAAWPFRPTCYSEADREKWMGGTYDCAAPIIQAFARCRLDAVAANRSPPSLVTPEHRIGDKVRITLPDFQGEPPHFVTGIAWHPKVGLSYTTSEVWPPKVEGLHICGLTDEWYPEHLAAAGEAASDVIGQA